MSGFQTPLVSILVACFWVAWWRVPPGRYQLSLLTLLTACCALTDPMAVVLVVPGLVAAAAQAERRVRARSIAIGLVPLAAWLLFAVVYYGFVVPNPIAAAWHAPWPLGDTARQGLYWLLDAVNNDPVAVAAIAGTFAASGWNLVARGGPLIGGLLAFLVIVVATGGDVFSGRSLAPAGWP